jgi:hypothetical protein
MKNRKKVISAMLGLTMVLNLAQAQTYGETYTSFDNNNQEEVMLVTTPSDKVESAEYTYLYAALTWEEYWASENVYEAGNTNSSTELDTKGETDKGAYDVVSRATANHGLHRGSFQSVAVIYDTDGNTYTVSYWTDSDNAVLTDGTTLKKASDRATGVTTLTLGDGTTSTMDHYEVTGIKYVPVKVETSDLEDFCKQYMVALDGNTIAGGYTEQKLTSYSLTAAVDENTNGLKTATKNSDGSFSFSARTTGTGSGILNTEQKKVDSSKIDVEVKEANGSYGEFLRVDLTGDAYGDLGSNMYAVVWTYYGNDSTYTKSLQSYGTKFAADNWMHKSMGIQLGLTDSLRCQLPKGTDGTGYWTITVCAMGYEDYTVQFVATADNIVASEEEEEVDTSELDTLVKQAQTLNESDYTADSWKDLSTELSESVEMLQSDTITQAMVDEQVKHLTDAINNLVKSENDTEESGDDSQVGSNTTDDASNDSQPGSDTSNDASNDSQPDSDTSNDASNDSQPGSDTSNDASNDSQPDSDTTYDASNDSQPDSNTTDDASNDSQPDSNTTDDASNDSQPDSNTTDDASNDSQPDSDTSNDTSDDNQTDSDTTNDALNDSQTDSNIFNDNNTSDTDKTGDDSSIDNSQNANDINESKESNNQSDYNSDTVIDSASNQNSSSASIDNTVNTGDESHVILWLSAMLLSGLGIAAVAKLRKKER